MQWKQSKVILIRIVIAYYTTKIISYLDLVMFGLGMCLLSNNILDYHFVSQGKTTIPNVDDGEEMLATDVS